MSYFEHRLQLPLFMNGWKENRVVKHSYSSFSWMFQVKGVWLQRWWEHIFAWRWWFYVLSFVNSSFHCNYNLTNSYVLEQSTMAATTLFSLNPYTHLHLGKLPENVGKFVRMCLQHQEIHLANHDLFICWQRSST